MNTCYIAPHKHNHAKKKSTPLTDLQLPCNPSRTLRSQNLSFHNFAIDSS